MDDDRPPSTWTPPRRSRGVAPRAEPPPLAAATIETAVARRAQVAVGAQAGVVQVTAGMGGLAHLGGGGGGPGAVRALLLTEAGWSQRKAAEFLGVDHKTVGSDVESDISPHLTDELLTEALDGLPPECLLRSAAVAELLGVTPGQVAKMANAGVLPGIRTVGPNGKPGRWRFRPAEVAALLADYRPLIRAAGGPGDEELIADFLETPSQLKLTRGRRADKRAALRRLSCWLAGAGLLHADTAAVSAWLRSIGPLGRVTEQAYVGGLHGFYVWAAGEGLVEGVATAPLRSTHQTRRDGRAAAPPPRTLPGSRKPTLFALATTYVESLRSTGEMAAITAAGVTYHLIGLCDVHGFDRPPAQLSERVAREWMAGIAHLAPTTRRTRYSNAKRFCTWLVRKGHIRADPFLEIPSPRVPRALHRALEHDQAAALLAVCPDSRARCVVLLGLQLGLRRAEIAGLEIGDISFTAGTVMIRRGAKGGHERLLPLTEEVRAALRRYLGESPIHAGALIRCDRYPSRPVSPMWVGRLISDLAWLAGIKQTHHDGVSTHALRHTAASDTYLSCRDVMAVSNMLGHVSLATTQVYVRGMDVEGLRVAMEGRTYRSP